MISLNWMSTEVRAKCQGKSRLWLCQAAQRKWRLFSSTFCKIYELVQKMAFTGTRSSFILKRLVSVSRLYIVRSTDVPSLPGIRVSLELLYRCKLEKLIYDDIVHQCGVPFCGLELKLSESRCVAHAAAARVTSQRP